MDVDRIFIADGDDLPTPDVAGPGEMKCPCGYFKIGTTYASPPGLTLMSQCPNCDRVIESWAP